jgi:hypothetical protein
VFAHGCTAVLDDFKRLEIYKGGKRIRENQLNQDKGQKAEVAAFLNAIREGSAPPIGLDALFSTSLVTFKTLESIATGKAIRL